MNEMTATLGLTLRSGDQPVLLGDLKNAIEELQGAISELAANLSRKEGAKVDFEIIGAEIGSLSLTLKPVPDPSLHIEAPQLLQVFTKDLDDIRQHKFRDDISGPLTERYRGFVRGIGRRKLTAEIVFEDRPILIDETFSRSFEAAFKERVSMEAELVGHLDAIRAHYEPFVFYLYPKLSGFGKIECRFPLTMLEQVRPMLKNLVRVKGTATYGPIGLYPSRVEITEAPSIATFSKDWLLSQIGTFNQLRQNETVTDLLIRNREAAGFAE